MKIFVSYASANRELIKELVGDLEALDHDIWFDQELSGGQAWWDEILKQILNCNLFIFTLSEDSIASEPCKREREYALALNKRFLPVYVADELDFKQLVPEIAKVHYVDYRNQDKDAFKSLKKAFLTLGDSVPLPNPLPKVPDAPISPLNEIAKMLSQVQLSAEEQHKILYELKSLQKGKTLKSATQLLEQFREHPALLASIYAQIEPISINPQSALPLETRVIADEKMTEEVKVEIRKMVKRIIDDEIDNSSLKVGLVVVSYEAVPSREKSFYITNYEIHAVVKDLGNALSPEISKMKNWECKKGWNVSDYRTPQKMSRLITKIADELVELNHLLGKTLRLTDIRWQ